MKKLLVGLVLIASISNSFASVKRLAKAVPMNQIQIEDNCYQGGIAGHLDLWIGNKRYPFGANPLLPVLCSFVSDHALRLNLKLQELAYDCDEAKVDIYGKTQSWMFLREQIYSLEFTCSE